MTRDVNGRLFGRRVLVTGAAGAFGARTCARLRAAGAQVVGLDRVVPAVPPDPEGLDVAAGLLRCDLTDPPAVRGAVAEAVRRLGGLDLLVHYAGIGEPVDAGAPPGEPVRRTLEVNLLGPWRVTAEALPALLEARGRAVFVASELAYATLPFAAAYAVSKRGLTAYADAVRMEYGARLSVSTVYPGYVRTPIHDASVAAGLSLEGQVRAETVDDVVSTVLRVAAARRPPRDTAATRLGGVELWLARHLPSGVDALVRARVARDVRRGRYDGVPLAGRIARLYRGDRAGWDDPGDRGDRGDDDAPAGSGGSGGRSVAVDGGADSNDP